MNMDGVGEKTIDLLLDHNLINTAVDLYTLTKGDILGLPGFKERSAQNVIDAIQRVRTVSLDRFLVSLSIEHIGEETARIIAESFPSVEAVRKASRESLVAIYGVGEIVADSLYTWIHTKTHSTFLDALLKQVTVIVKESTRNGALANKTLVFTGTLPTLGRTEAENIARAHGAHVTSSVSKKTDYAVVGVDPGSNAKKARALGVTILDETGFRALMNE
jgi:DNA ligase (NAD+)